MKVAVTSQGQGLDSPVDARFGRAACFIVADTEAGGHTVHDNAQNLNALQGAGIQSARTVQELGVEAVVTGNIGPKAFTALRAAGIAVYIGAAGSVAEALERLQAGKLARADAANVGGRWA